MASEEPKLPGWATAAATENKYLPDLLSLASTNFGRHADWFIRYREAGIRDLAVIFAAESGLIGIALSPKGGPAVLFIGVLLIVLGFASLLLVWLAISSCKRSFVAEMECLFVMAMTAWAMGLTSDVAVDEAAFKATMRPKSVEKTLYANRWVDGTFKHKTCAKFVEANLRSRNTYFVTKTTIKLFGAIACLLGWVGGGVLIRLHCTGSI